MLLSALLLSLSLTPASASEDIHCEQEGGTVANVLGFFSQYTPFSAFPRQFDFNPGMQDIALKPNEVSPPITFQLIYHEEANQATLVNLNQVPLHICRFANSQIDYTACYELPQGLNALNTSQALQAIRRQVETAPRIDMSQQEPYMGYSMSLYTWPVAPGQNAAYQEVKFPALVASASKLYRCDGGRDSAVSQSEGAKQDAYSAQPGAAPLDHGQVVIDQ